MYRYALHSVAVLIAVMQVVVPLLPAIVWVDFELRKSDLIKYSCEQRYQRENCCMASCQLEKNIRAVDDSQEEDKQRSTEEYRIFPSIPEHRASEPTTHPGSVTLVGCAELFRARMQPHGDPLFHPPSV